MASQSAKIPTKPRKRPCKANPSDPITTHLGRDNVRHAHAESVVEQPVVDDDLRIVQKIACPSGAKVVPAHVNEAALGGFDRRTVDGSG